MNQSTLKLAGALVLCALVITSGTILAATGKLDAPTMFGQMTTLVGHALIALGLVSAGGGVTAGAERIRMAMTSAPPPTPRNAPPAPPGGAL